VGEMVFFLKPLIHFVIDIVEVGVLL